MDKPLYFKTRVDAVSECFPGICCTEIQAKESPRVALQRDTLFIGHGLVTLHESLFSDSLFWISLIYLKVRKYRKSIKKII